MMNTDIHQYISDLRHTTSVAGLNYEIWWVYKNNRPEYVDVMNKYELFFQTSIHAHFVALLVALYRLYETRKDTLNIPSLLKILKSESSLQESTLVRLENIYTNEAKPLWIKISILRNKVFGHRSVEYGADDAFREAGITPDELRDLLEITKKLLNELTRTLDRSCHAFNLNSREDTLSLLNDLKAM